MKQEHEEIEVLRGGVGRVEKRVAGVHSAWKRLRPAKVLYGMTLKDFEAHVKPFKDAVAEIEELKTRLLWAYSNRNAGAIEAMKAVQGVVSAVKGDPTEGEDGALYAAMGYTPLSRRKSGLKRPQRESSIADSSSG